MGETVQKQPRSTGKVKELAMGYGASTPLKRLPGENMYAAGYRYVEGSVTGRFFAKSYYARQRKHLSEVSHLAIVGGSLYAATGRRLA